MTPAPNRLRDVASPATFSASKLSVLETCVLRAVASGEPLPSSGTAGTVGTWLHDFAECVRGSASAWTWKQGLQELDSFLSARGASLANPPAEWTPLAWQEACHRALRYAAQDAGSKPEKPGAPPRRSGRVPQNANSTFDPSSDLVWRTGTGTYSELTLVDPQLRVAGRVDRVTLGPGNVVITDFKTGAGVGRDGRPSRAAWLQLSAYGAYVRRVRPDAQVHLNVVGTRSVEWLCDRECAAEVEGVLRDAAVLLPADAVVPARTLAHPGEACLFCAQRPVCPAYPEASAAWQREGADHPFPDDVSGVVVTDVPVVNGLDLITDSGSRIRLRNVPDAVLEEVDVGTRIDTYGRRRSTKIGARHHQPLTLDGNDRVYYTPDQC